MKKSILALLCMLFALFAVPMAYADEDATDDSSASTEEPLPPLTDSGESGN